MQHAEKKGETIKNLWVIRRVGGLEVIDDRGENIRNVIRRVGGLEDLKSASCSIALVVRRVGG